MILLNYSGLRLRLTSGKGMGRLLPLMCLLAGTLAGHGLEAQVSISQKCTLLCQKSIWDDDYANRIAIDAIILSQPLDWQDDMGRSALHFAVRYARQSELIGFLVTERGAPSGIGNWLGQTAVHEAVLAGQVYNLQALLDAGVAPDLADHRSVTPLHLAVSYLGSDELTGDITDSGEVDAQIAATALAMTRALIEAGAEVDARSGQRQTPLHWAARAGNDRRLITILLEAGADVAATDIRQQQPLHVAARAGSQVMVQALLDGGADPRARDYLETQPLHLAANGATVDLLLSGGADPNAVDIQGWTPLHWIVVHHPDTHGLSSLLASEAMASEAVASVGVASRAVASEVAAVNVEDSEGNTPLHLAAVHSDRPEVIAMLRAAGASVTRQNRRGKTALARAVVRRDRAALMIAGALLEGEDGASALDITDLIGNSPLHEAAREARLQEMVNLLLNRGALEDDTNFSGELPFHLSVRDASSGEITLLLLEGSREDFYNTRTRNGETIIHLAAAYLRDPRVLVDLLSNERLALLSDNRNRSGETPLHWAVRYSHRIEILPLLVRAGADPNSRTRLAGATPLHWAARYASDRAVVDALIRVGASIRNRDNEGNSVLHYASRYNSSPEIITALLEYDAGVNVRNNLGEIPLHWAAREAETPDIAGVLLDAGADRGALDHQGRDACQLAQENVHPQAARSIRILLCL